jgi:hypothetical protein
MIFRLFRKQLCSGKHFQKFYIRSTYEMVFYKKECGTWKDKFRFVFGELNLEQMHLPQKNN